jgi:hypothetical protein
VAKRKKKVVPVKEQFNLRSADEVLASAPTPSDQEWWSYEPVIVRCAYVGCETSVDEERVFCDAHFSHILHTVKTRAALDPKIREALPHNGTNGRRT